MRFDVITLFPEAFTALTESGVSRRALVQGLYEFKAWNPRQFTQDKHQTVDDRPYGGGPGMLMMYQPLKDTVDAIKQEIASEPLIENAKTHVIVMSPQGRPLTQQKVAELALKSHITIVCGRYEGIDERFITSQVDEEIAVGDFIVSGGELPAMMMMDAVIRLVPGTLGHHLSAVQDSFSDGLLDCPHYTRPEEVDGMKVPDVLLEGHHAKIDAWRHAQKISRTQNRRPDLYKVYLADNAK
jgi:tRNA (guanine37-N1)-methyltransferase